GRDVMSSYRDSAGRVAVVTLVVLLPLAGCDSGPKTYPVNGRVEFTDGDVKKLAGRQVEAMLESEPTVRAYGEIQDDGRFSLGMHYDGKVRGGAPEGTYQLRILPTDEELAAEAAGPGGLPAPGHRPPIDRRFLEFSSSDCRFNVPTDGEVLFKVSQH